MSGQLADSDRKEQLSIAYMHALAAKCGYTYAELNLDRDSVDIEISDGGLMSPKIAWQLKATSAPRFLGNGDLSFDLPVKNYDDLRKRRLVPAYLGVLILPDGKDEWCSISEGELILRYRMYWLSLDGYPEIDIGQKAVHLPKSNILNDVSLTQLIDKARA